MAIEPTCASDRDGALPTVEFEVTEAFKGTNVGDDVTLQWWDGGEGCPPDTSIGEEWVLVPSEDSYSQSCDPGFPLSDPESDELLALLRSQSTG